MKLISHKERSDLIEQHLLDYEPTIDYAIDNGQKLNSVYHSMLKDFNNRQDTEYFKQFYTIPFLNFKTFKLRLFDKIPLKYDITSIKPKFIQKATRILSKEKYYGVIEKQFNTRLINDIEQTIVDYEFYNDLYRLAIYCENHNTVFENDFESLF